MKQPLSHKTRAIRKMKPDEWHEYINQFLPDQDSTYKGKLLQNFDGWKTDKVEKWLKDKEKEYTVTKIKGDDVEFLNFEIVHGRQELASRRAKYFI